MIAVLARLAPLALAALAAAPVQEVVDLQQITIRVPPGAAKAQRGALLKAFARATAGIRTCSQIEAVAHRVNGKVLASAQVSLANIPPQLGAQLLGKPAGTVTHVFGAQAYGEGGEYRVLIRC